MARDRRLGPWRLGLEPDPALRPGSQVEAGPAGRGAGALQRCLYGGVAEGGWVYGPPEAGLLVLGPPRSGKTASLVVPNVLRAAGAVVVTSTKPDVLGVTLLARRKAGRCWVFDPSATMAIPEGATALCWSPLSGCAEWSGALARAHALARASRPGRGLAEATHWVERAEALLGPLLHAAALGALPMEAVLRWVLRREVAEALGLLGEGSLAGDALAGIDSTDERERSGIFSTAASILSPYRSSATLAAAATPNFSPSAFVGSADTVYVCAPAHAQDQLAPLVVALLDEIASAGYARGGDEVPVLFALDEVANIAPLPSLPALVAEGGGQGVLTLACLQDLSQARARWGEAASGFLSLFGAKVVLGGIADHATLALVSELCGEADVAVYSQSWGRWPGLRSSARPTRSVTTVRRRRLGVDAVAKGVAGCGLWIEAGSSPGWVGLTPWYSCSPWAEVVKGEAPGLVLPPAGRARRALAKDWRAWAVAAVVLIALLGLPQGRWPGVVLAVGAGAIWWRGRRAGTVGGGGGGGGDLGGGVRLGWGRPGAKRRWAGWVLAGLVVVMLPFSWWSVAVAIRAGALGWRAWAERSKARPG